MDQPMINLPQGHSLASKFIQLLISAGLKLLIWFHHLSLRPQIHIFGDLVFVVFGDISNSCINFSIHLSTINVMHSQGNVGTVLMQTQIRPVSSSKVVQDSSFWSNEINGFFIFEYGIQKILGTFVQLLFAKNVTKHVMFFFKKIKIEKFIVWYKCFLREK